LFRSDMDFVVGNVGLNNQIKASPERPASIWYADFDDNGSVDPILNYYIMGRSYPYPTRDELVGQLPAFRKRFNDYASYSRASLDDLLTSEEKESAAKDRKSTRLNSSHVKISYAVFCLKKKKKNNKLNGNK